MSFSSTNPNHEEEIISDENNNAFEHTLIDDISNNGYLMQEEVRDHTYIYNGSLRYTILGRTFSTSDDAYDFYNGYGLSKGFGRFKDMNDKTQLRDDVKRRCNTWTGCKALMQVTLSSESEWVVDKFSDEHNHPFDSPSKVIKQRSHSIFHRSNECKDVVTLLSKAGMKPSEITKIVNAFRAGEEDQLTRVQCSSIVTEERKCNLGKECHGIIMHFKEKAEVDKDFYFAMDINEDGTLKEKYHIEDDSWLGNMFKLRHHWVKAYLKDTFFAGMTTSGRSESIHSFFDGFVNAKTMLNEFVVQYDKAKEWKASFDCGHQILSTNGVKVIYRAGFLKGNKENWKTVEYNVTSDIFVTCSCARFETSGILCKHILYIMRRESLTTIPDHYIIPRWTMKATYKVGGIET
ncbi:protein FAR1-RELATED SEQUENCE 5 [Artemisia annua]|uniref:Protein FAR1-RELATED SEQUENCE 5 n=1 Tax=Artemisia annua TaxID=35608 RepID=A0A2U1NJQ2_ARTAN|nr:protein FAR1-RELATED SEQUENCE 5 [Artemisia annua]